MKKNIMLSAVMVFGLGVFGACSNPTPGEPSSQDLVDTNNNTNESEEYVNDFEETETNDTSSTKDFENLDVSLEDLISIFEAEHPEAFITNIELDWSLGDIYYEIEGVDNEAEHEFRVNAATGEIDRHRSETVDLVDTKLTELEDLISISEVIDIVRDLYPEATIASIDINRSVGNIHWEVEMRHSTLNYIDITIDAQTGEILEVDR